ncbi:Copper amine oxidase N-terminal domain-containing protein [Paenibacillaceae bacterium GAS479]|nr:Copper amine oxidase N-terminal domain-containing protein [Paenibacillaceae bacterium GAS479]
MKKTVCGILLAIGWGLFLHPANTQAGFAPPTPASDLSQLEVNVNGEFIKQDVTPIVDQGRVFIPIRTLSSLGISYSWNSTSKITTVQNKNGDYLKVTVGSSEAYKNGKLIQLESPPQNIDGRVLVPMRFISESLGYQVNYEIIRKIVFVQSDDYQFDANLLNQENLDLARKAALSLPLNANFKPLAFPTLKYHQYRFPIRKADSYMFSDGYTSSIVEIKGGKATVTGQFVMGARSEFSHKSGNISGNDTSDPVLKPFLYNVAVFGISLKDSSQTDTYFIHSDNSQDQFNSMPMNIYSDIIQKIPKEL